MTRTSRLVTELPSLVVCLVAAAGLYWVWRHNWREGLFVLAAAFLAGSLLRLVLPARRVGLLAVRGRFLDVLFLGGLGAAVLLLAAVVPFQR